METLVLPSLWSTFRRIGKSRTPLNINSPRKAIWSISQLLHKHAQSRQCRSHILIMFVSFAFASGLSTLSPFIATAGPQDSPKVSREDRIKAAFIYNFGHYIKWPPGSFSDSKSPFAIGIVGASPVAVELGAIAMAKRIQDRPIALRQISSWEDIQGCHIVFVPKSVEPSFQEVVLKACLGKPIFVAGENTAFIDRGGMAVRCPRFLVQGL